MKILSSLLLSAALMPPAVHGKECETGIYRASPSSFVAVTKADKGYNYAFSDGVVGNTLDAASPLACGEGRVRVTGKGDWPKVAVKETDTRFQSHGITLAGRLMEAPGAGKDTTLVVFAHGSEDSGWIDRSPEPSQMLGRGISVFVYDKRGTGLSQGEYVQNFPRLADDQVAASLEARRLAADRFGRFGFVGLSQGGWIAPLAANRAKAEFLAIGYGLAVDIAEEDAEQVALELSERGYGQDVLDKGRLLTDITARIVKSGFKDGLDDLESAQKQYGGEPWFKVVRGAYTGVFLTIPVDYVRKNGIPQFEKLQVDWTQKPMDALRQVSVPQLWVFAEKDRQAPSAQTVERLNMLRKEGKDIRMAVFPGAEHGMWQFEQAPDYSRKRTRIAPGFHDLMADWANGKVKSAPGAYGNASRP